MPTVDSNTFFSTRPAESPLAVQSRGEHPGIQHVTARFVGIGVRPEHIRTPKSLLHRLAIATGIAAAVLTNLSQRGRRFKNA